MDMRSRSPNHEDIFTEVYLTEWNRLVRTDKLVQFQPHIVKEAIDYLNQALYLLLHTPNHPENKVSAAKRVDTAKFMLTRLMNDMNDLKKQNNS